MDFKQRKDKDAMLEMDCHVKGLRILFGQLLIFSDFVCSALTYRGRGKTLWSRTLQNYS